MIITVSVCHSPNWHFHRCSWKYPQKKSMELFWHSPACSVLNFSAASISYRQWGESPREPLWWCLSTYPCFHCHFCNFENAKRQLQYHNNCCWGHTKAGTAQRTYWNKCHFLSPPCPTVAIPMFLEPHRCFLDRAPFSCLSYWTVTYMDPSSMDLLMPVLKQGLEYDNVGCDSDYFN